MTQRFPFASPSLEFAKFKGFNKVQQIDKMNDSTTLHDLLMGLLLSADSIAHDIRQIRLYTDKRLEQLEGWPEADE